MSANWLIVHSRREQYAQRWRELLPRNEMRPCDKIGALKPEETHVSASQALINRVLLTNDDGIDAPGLAVLEHVAAMLAREVWVVAPERDQSGTSHSISLHSPLRITQRGERRFGVVGTPGDCVVMAARYFMRDVPPDLVLSGINRGANLGVETVFSGTVGAAMTGMLLGLRSIALSQAFTHSQKVRWETARTLAPDVVRRLLDAPWGEQTCLNVNFPDVPPEDAGPLTVSKQGVGLVQSIDVHPYVDPREIPYFWLQFQRGPRDDADDSETAIIGAGAIAVTPLRFERTDDSAFSLLCDALR
jgi:5'-nucleotidase